MWIAKRHSATKHSLETAGNHDSISSIVGAFHGGGTWTNMVRTKKMPDHGRNKAVHCVSTAVRTPKRSQLDNQAWKIT
jgi:hypothetical protein